MEEEEFSKSQIAILNYFRVSVSTIWFIRKIFKEEYFKIFHGNDSTTPEFVRVEKEKVSTNKDLKNFVHHWLEEGAVHLIRKRYLSCAVFYVCRDAKNPFQTLIESYEWCFKYSPKGDFEESEVEESKIRDYYSVLYKSMSSKIPQNEIQKGRNIGMFYKYNDSAPISYDLGDFAKPVNNIGERYVFGMNKTKRIFLTGFYGKYHRCEIYVRTMN